jgi:hypothetical protein
VLFFVSGSRSEQLTINQWHARSVRTPDADASEIPIHELRTSDLEAFFHDLRCKLIHAVINSPVENMLHSTALVMRSTVLTDVLDAPISELPMSEYINLCQHFFNCRSLLIISIH